MNVRPWVLCLSLLACVPHENGMNLVEASECLVGCELLSLYAFDDDGLVEWDERGTCDTSAGCEVITPDAVNGWRGCGYTAGDECLWATVSGTDGSSDCTCSVCGAYRQGSSVYYMDEYPMWTRIACFLADMEAIGYDISVCVAAVIDDGAMACVDDEYEPPTVGQFDCPATELEDNSAEVECLQSGAVREAAEMFAYTSTSSYSIPAPTTDPTPAPAADPTMSDEDVVLTPSPNSAISSELSSTTDPPTTETEVSCVVGSICPGDLCCHPDSNTCGRKHTFCQERDFFNGVRCCSGAEDDPSEENVCSEDSICEEPEGESWIQKTEVWASITASVVAILAVCAGCACSNSG